ncbi:MAG: hypothetical protein DRJ45_08450 [Thermoprotei archaeon]|nr:MAG: hypothetical protein DRJ45_08450 [Thermoprotei archaeon]
MKYLEWCGLFEIGVQVIDNQHKMLFRIANDFVDAVAGRQADNKVAFQTLNALTRYAQDHFGAEEDAARQVGFPEEDLKKLSESHEQLVQEIFDLHARVSETNQFNINEVEQFLADWLIMHVLIEDRKIKQFVGKEDPSST